MPGRAVFCKLSMVPMVNKNNSIDLKGLHLFVTRPQAQARPWAEKLKRLGALVTCEPMLSISSLEDEVSTQAIKNQVLALDEYQKIIFVSQNAVAFAMPWIDKYWPQLPCGLDFFAIGSSTAAALNKALVSFDASVASPTQAMNSEALLALPELRHVENQQVLIMRGQGGRTYLGESLQQRGARVNYCELYERQIPDTIDDNKIREFTHSTALPVAIVHSGETLNNLCAVLSVDDLHWFKEQLLLVPGERVAQQARLMGFQLLIIAENATHESMIEALNGWRQQHKGYNTSGRT